MARKRSSTRKTRKPKTWRRYAGKALTQLSKSATKALKKTLGLNTENKNYDTQMNQATTATLTSALLPTAALAQGTTNNTRTGNGLRITHWNFKGYMINSLTNTVAQQVRVVVTFQPSVVTAGDEVSNSELLQVATDINSFYNTNLQDVRVLYDKVHILKPQYSGSQDVKRFKIKWAPSYDLGHVTWTDADTTGATANLLKGILKMWIMTDQTSDFPSVVGRSRVYFVDN